MVWAGRIATLFAAVCGNATHVYLGALTIVGGWPAFVAQFKRGFEQTACFSCTVQFYIVMYVIWYGAPFYLLAVPAFAARSIAIIVVTLLSVAGLIALDVTWYYGGNSKDWYILLSPILLGGVALVACFVLVFIGVKDRARRGKQQ